MRRGLAGVFVFLISFAVHGAVGFTWDRMGVFEELDVLFDTDPSRMVYGFIHEGHLQNWRHPNLGPLARPILSTACAVAHLWHVYDPPSDCPYYLVAFLAPLAAGLKSFCFFRAMLACGLGVAQALLWTLLEVVSFSSLVFGSIPESYAFSGLAVAAAFWLAARRQRAAHIAYWSALAVLTTAVTTSNLVPLALLFVAVAWRPASWPRVAAQAALIVAAGVLGNGLLLWVNRPADKPLAWGQAEDRTQSYVSRTLRELPGTLVATIVAPRVRWVANDASEKTGGRFVRRVEQRPLPWPLILVCIAIVGGLAGAALSRPGETAERRALRVGALVMLGFHLALHCLFRKHDLLLYSQHWHVALLFAMLPLHDLTGWRRYVAALAVAAIGAVNGLQLREMTAELKRTSQSDHSSPAPRSIRTARSERAGIST